MDKLSQIFQTHTASSNPRRRVAVGWTAAWLLAWLIGVIVLSMSSVKPVAAQSNVTPAEPCFTSRNLTNLSGGGQRGITNQPVISGNGERVSFWSVNQIGGGNPDGNIEVFVSETGSNSVVQLTQSVGSILGGFNLEPSINTDGTHIAFYSDRDLVVGQNLDGNFEIFLARLAPGGTWSIIQITNTEGSANLFPSINAAGNRIAFVSDDAELHSVDQTRVNTDRNFEIFLAEIPASGAVQFRQITNSGAGVTNDQPVIDAAGNRVAFTASAGQAAQVFVWDASQGAPLQLTQSDINDQPSISADGTSIVYIATDSTDRSRIVLHTLSADGAESRAEVIVPAATNTKYRGPSISGNGERVVYVTEQGSGAAIQINVLLYDINTSLSVPISDVGGGTGEQPAISSDGTRVTFVGVQAIGGSTDNSGSDIYLNDCPQGDLVLEFVSPPPATVLAGVDVSYQFRITNRGPSAATGVFVRSDLSLLPSLPANVDFLLPASCTIDANEVLLCLIGNLGVNESRDFTFGYDVPSNAGLADIVSEITVGGDLVDPDLSNNGSGRITTTVFEEAALTLQVTTNRASILAGSPDELIYDLLVTSAGPSQARSAVIENTLAVGAVLKSYAIVQGGGAGAGCPAPVGNVVTCNLGNLTAGSSTLIRIVVTAHASASQNFANVATVRSLTAESNLANNTVVTTTTVERSADMSISKSAHASSVVAGREITYTLTFTNNGFADTLDVVVIDTLSPYLSYARSVLPNGASCVANVSSVTCSFPGTLLVGQSVTFNLVALVASNAPAAPIANTARVLSGRADPNPANDVSPAMQTNVTLLADLGVTKTVSKNLPDVNEAFAYTVKVRNFGPSQATGVSVSDVLSSALTFDSASATLGSYDYGTGIWTVGTLPAGQEQTLTINVRAKETAGGLLVANTATATSGVPELLPGTPNFASVSVTPQRADMQIGISSVPSSATRVVAGKRLTYTLTITNAGPTLARSVTLSNDLPDNVFFVSISPPAGCSGSDPIVCNVGNMASGATLNYTLVITRAASGMITNVASVSSLTPELTGQGANNSATHTIQVLADIPNRLQFVGALPNSIQAGVPISPPVAVRILDQFNNLVEETIGSTDTIRLEPYLDIGTPCTNLATASALNNSQADAINGIATFNGLNYTVAERIRLLAIDSEPGRTGVTACSTAMSVNPDTVKQLHFVTPEREIVAGDISALITISRTDRFGNDTSVDPFTADLTVLPASGRFLDEDGIDLGDEQEVVIASGFVTTSFRYTNVVAGTYMIEASAPGVTSAVQSLTVVAAPAEELLVVLSGPVTATAGVRSDLFTVQRRDRFNNPNSSEPNVTVNLETEPFPLSGGFRNPGDTQNITQIVIPQGSSVAQFRYINTVAATHSISITDAAVGPTQLKGDAVTITVVPAATHSLHITSQPQVITAGDFSNLIRVERRDSFGNNNTQDANLQVTLSSSSAGIGGVPTFRNASGTPTNQITILKNSDYAEFDYSDELARSFTLTASSPGKISATQVITVTPDVPAQLAIITTTNSIVAGSPPFVITLQRQDQYDNPAASANPLVITPDTSSPGGRFLQVGNNNEATQVTIPANQTNASLRYTDTRAGLWLLGFEATPPFYASQSLAVSAGAPVKLVYLQKPMTVTAGLPSAPFVVQRQDVHSNPYAGPESLTVNLDSTSPSGVFSNGSSGVTSVIINSGTSTTTFLYGDNKAGVRTVTASDDDGEGGDGPLNDAVTPFTVTPAAANKLVFINGPITVTAGELSAPLTVQVQDTHGNPVTPSISSPIVVNLTTTNDATGSFRDPVLDQPLSPAATLTIGGESSKSFRYRDTKAGDPKPSITANDPGPLSPDNDTVTVVPAATSKIAFIAPLPPVQGTAGMTSTVVFTVQQQDAFNNPTFEAVDRVLTLQSSSAGPKQFVSPIGTPGTVLSPPQVIIPTNNSIASFRYYDQLRGQHVITVTTTGLTMTTNVITTPQTILGTDAVRLALTNIPAQIVAGSSPQLTITALDRFGNHADPYNGSKTLIFNGPLPGPNGAPPTVSNNAAGTPSFGADTVLTFSNGLLTAGGVMRLYDAANAVGISAQDKNAPAITTAGGGALTVDVLPDILHRVQPETTSGGAEVGVIVPPTTIEPGIAIQMWSVGRDQWGNSRGNVTPDSWQLTPTGGVVGTDLATSGAQATFTGHLSGTAVIAPVEGGAISVPSGKITVTAGSADVVHVELAPGTPVGVAQPVTARTLTAGDTLNVYAVVRDSLGNFKRNEAATWTIESPTQGVSTAANLNAGSSASNIFSAKLVGTGLIRATIGAATSVDSGLITVQNDEATHFAVSKTPAGAVLVNATQTFSITALDGFNNVDINYTGSHNLLFSGAAPSRAPQTFPFVVDNGQNEVPFTSSTPLVFSAGHFIGTAAGVAPRGQFRLFHAPYPAAPVVISVTDGDIVGTLSVNVTPDAANRIAISAPTYTITAGSGVSLTLTAEDVWGNRVPSYGATPNLIFAGTPDPAVPGFATLNPTVSKRSPLGLIPFGSPTEIEFTDGQSSTSGGNNGVMRIFKAGNDYTISVQVSGGTLPSGAHGSQVFDVLPSTSEVMRLNLATPQVNGTPFVGTNVITLTDSYGNPVSPRNVTLTTSLPGVITINGGSNVVNVANGSTMFNLTYEGLANATALFTATATLPLGGTIIATDTVYVGHTALDHYGLSISDIPEGAGSALASTLIAYDHSGNVVLSVEGFQNIDFTGGVVAPDGTTPKINQGEANMEFSEAGLSFVNGQADFAVRLYKAQSEAQNIQVQGGIASNSEAVTVLPGPHAAFEVVIGTEQPLTSTFVTPARLTAMDFYSNVVTGFGVDPVSVVVTIETFPEECVGVAVVSGLYETDDATPAVLDHADDFDEGVALLAEGHNAMGVLDGCMGDYRFQFQSGEIVALSEVIWLEDSPP